MKVTCPKDHKHDRFETVVHVTEDWVVNNEPVGSALVFAAWLFNLERQVECRRETEAAQI